MDDSTSSSPVSVVFPDYSKPIQVDEGKSDFIKSENENSTKADDNIPPCFPMNSLPSATWVCSTDPCSSTHIFQAKVLFHYTLHNSTQ